MPEQAVLENISYGSINTHLLVSAEEDKEEAVGESLKEMVEARPELTMETLAERKAAYEQSANQIFGMISGLAVFIMMFSILSMMNTLITNIVTKKQELAMLESIGMEERQVRNMLFGESFLLALPNILITLTFGTITGFAFISFMQKSATYLEYHFPIIAVVLYIIGMIGIPMLISLGCLKRQNNISLVERIRNED